VVAEAHLHPLHQLVYLRGARAGRPASGDRVEQRVRLHGDHTPGWPYRLRCDARIAQLSASRVHEAVTLAQAACTHKVVDAARRDRPQTQDCSTAGELQLGAVAQP